jgi:hypothetical protein
MCSLRSAKLMRGRRRRAPSRRPAKQSPPLPHAAALGPLPRAPRPLGCAEREARRALHGSEPAARAFPVGASRRARAVLRTMRSRGRLCAQGEARRAYKKPAHKRLRRQSPRSAPKPDDHAPSAIGPRSRKNGEVRFFRAAPIALQGTRSSHSRLRKNRRVTAPGHSRVTKPWSHAVTRIKLDNSRGHRHHVTKMKSGHTVKPVSVTRAYLHIRVA